MLKRALGAIGLLAAPAVALGLVFGFHLGFTVLLTTPAGLVLVGAGCALVLLFVLAGFWEIAIDRPRQEERRYWERRLYTYQRLLKLYGLLHKLPPEEGRLALHALGIKDEEYLSGEGEGFRRRLGRARRGSPHVT